MGVSCGGVAFKADTSTLNLSKIIADLFGSRYQINKGYCDSRNADCIYAGMTNEFVIIVHSELASAFFAATDTTGVQKYLDYFSSPELVFAFEAYDSGGTYSYCLIEKGEVRRQFRSISYEKSIDYGAPLDKERKWLQAPTYTDDDGDTYIKDADADFECMEDQLPQVLLQELMQEKLGFIPETMDDNFREQYFFKQVVTIEQPLADESGSVEQNKKPWWKLW